LPRPHHPWILLFGKHARIADEKGSGFAAVQPLRAADDIARSLPLEIPAIARTADHPGRPSGTAIDRPARTAGTRPRAIGGFAAAMPNPSGEQSAAEMAKKIDRSGQPCSDLLAGSFSLLQPCQRAASRHGAGRKTGL
jgi:hypothetical protein